VSLRNTTVSLVPRIRCLHVGPSFCGPCFCFALSGLPGSDAFCTQGGAHGCAAELCPGLWLTRPFGANTAALIVMDRQSQSMQGQQTSNAEWFVSRVTLAEQNVRNRILRQYQIFNTPGLATPRGNGPNAFYFLAADGIQAIV